MSQSDASGLDMERIRAFLSFPRGSNVSKRGREELHCVSSRQWRWDTRVGALVQLI